MKPPIIRVLGPPKLIRGGEAAFDVELVLADVLEVAGVTARFLGRDGWVVGGIERAQTHVDQTARPVGATLLPAGTNRIPLVFRTPHTIAPSHQYHPAWSHVTLQVTIRRRGFWKRNFQKSFAFNLGVIPPLNLHRQMITVRSPSPPGAAYIELSLATSQVVAGETLLGSCAAFHVDDSKARTITLALRPRFRLLDGAMPARQVMGSPIWITITLPRGGAGQALPFRFLIPAIAVSSFRAKTQEMMWEFSARLGDLTSHPVAALPILIVDAAAAALATPLTMPVVADSRVAALFAGLETSGWAVTGARGDDARIAVERMVGRDLLRLSYVYRGERGTYLVAQISGASLGLDLEIVPSSGLRKLFSKDIVVGVPGWDRDYHVGARSEVQARPMLEAAVLPLSTLRGTMVRWTDTELVFEDSIGGLEATDLDAMTAALDAAHEILGVARAAILPPPGLEIDLAAWQALARRLEGVLAPGDLSIVGRAGHLPAALGLVFEPGDPPHVIAVRAKVGDPESASAIARGIVIRSATPSVDSHDAGEAISDMLHRWPADFVDLEIVDGTAAARWRTTEPQPERAHELVQALAAILTALDPGAGPYR